MTPGAPTLPVRPGCGCMICHKAVPGGPPGAVLVRSMTHVQRDGLGVISVFAGPDTGRLASWATVTSVWRSTRVEVVDRVAHEAWMASARYQRTLSTVVLDYERLREERPVSEEADGVTVEGEVVPGVRVVPAHRDYSVEVRP